MRINKFLAECGVASRRSCDKMIEEEHVTINGKVAKLGDKVLERDIVAVQGKEIHLTRQYAYYMMHKPKGYICSVKDDRDRKTIFSLMSKKENERLYPIGRLDYDSEGLLLLTNDGDLTFRLTHPIHEIPKTYLLKVEGELTMKQVEQLKNGVLLDGKMTKKCNIKLLESRSNLTKLEITITEGRNRQVRKMFESIGTQVVFLKRIKIGDMTLGSLKRGEVRPLTSAELYYLKNL